MSNTTDLNRIASKGERAQSVRLARAHGLSMDEALHRTLTLKAGKAGLAALVETRLAAQAAQAARDSARAAHLASTRTRPASHAGTPAWRAWFDGSARPNPGRCAIGALLLGPDGQRIEIARAAGHGDSSEAEYRALIALLDAAIEHGAANLAIHGDSQVVIGDVSGPNLLAAPALSSYRSAALERLARLPGCTLRWVPRHKNQEADALSQRAFGPALAEETGDAAHA